jgi:hypothetical protein
LRKWLEKMDSVLFSSTTFDSISKGRVIQPKTKTGVSPASVSIIPEKTRANMAITESARTARKIFPAV